MPMTLVPTIVTFLTLMIISDTFPGKELPSFFTIALIQIPADFVTGIFCSLIAFIILNAPKKEDKDAPIMFTLNIMERKDLILKGAIVYVIFGYLISGAMGFMHAVFEPIQQAAQAKQGASLSSTFFLFFLMAILFYGFRFILLPILIIGQIDIAGFYKKYSKFGFSFPIFFVKALPSLIFSLMIFTIGPLFRGSEDTLSPVAEGIIHFISGFGTVLAAAWTMASLSIGIRKMLEGGAES